uniref:Uncharacterized protein n=1 Tax=Romanomermis culicivorax TaxID=13658 RepID=A0A915L6L7_ROMCU
MQSTHRYGTKGKFSFRSVRLEVTVRRFPQNFSRPFRPKVDRKRQSANSCLNTGKISPKSKAFVIGEKINTKMLVKGLLDASTIIKKI